MSTQEYNYTRRAVRELIESGLHARLTRELQSDSDYRNPDKWPLFFEARFAYELLRAGIKADYEYPTGVGEDSVDFRFVTERQWLVELVSPQSSESAIRNTAIADHSWGKTFSQIPDAGVEATRLTDKIIDKAADGTGNARKFPLPDSSTAHMVVVDMRRYLDGHVDRFDFRELAHGSGALPKDFPFHTLVPGETYPIKGVFEQGHPYPRTQHLRQRVHFISFIVERNFEEGEIASHLYTEPNPNIFANTEDAYEVFESFPLRPTERRS